MARSSGTWKKGDPSPNPAGRPKDGESMAGILRAVGDEVPKGKDERTYKHRLAEVLWKRAAVDEDLSAARLLLEYTELKPRDADNRELLERLARIEADLAVSGTNGHGSN